MLYHNTYKLGLDFALMMTVSNCDQGHLLNVFILPLSPLIVAPFQSSCYSLIRHTSYVQFRSMPFCKMAAGVLPDPAERFSDIPDLTNQ